MCCRSRYDFTILEDSVSQLALDGITTTPRRYRLDQGDRIMKKSQGVYGNGVSARRGICRAGTIKLLSFAAMLCLAAGAEADQLLVTGANRDGNAVYDLGITPGGSTPLKPVIASTVTQINSAADAKTHAGFDAMVWVANPVCQSLDLIVADGANGQIVRYAGATTLPNCNAPASTSSGTPQVNPAAQILFKWSKRGSGPAQPTGISADANGNLFVVASSGSWDPNASVWVLPFNKTKNLYCSGTGNYCPPVLVDEKFCGTYTQQLSEVLVAGVAAGNGGKSALWNVGDVLVLVGDSFDARLLDYAQTKLYYGSGNKAGLLNLAALPLNQPTSTPIPWSVFHAQSAAPAGMDIWPANPLWHTNTTLLITTADGRILEFDSLLNKVVCNFAANRGAGLQKIKVGSYASVSYAFVAQLEAHNTGQILVFAAAPVTGPNNPIKTISSGIMNPVGLAVTSAGSASLPAGTHGAGPCTTNPCVIDPLGPELVTTINAGSGDHLSGTVLEQNCIVTSDPRVTGSGASWTCNGNALPIGAGAASGICPSFPAAVIPGSVCGHSGPTGSGFAVIEGTALGIDPNDNNSFITTVGNADAVLPGATNLECTPFSGHIPLIAWGTRSDLTTVEGLIAEDTNGSYGASLGGAAGFLTELTGGCDTSTTGSRGISIFAIGLGLSYTNPSDIYNLVDQKYGALVQTLNGADLTDGGTVYNTLYNYFSAAAGYAYSASVAVNPSPAFTNDINCALNQIVDADSYLRQPSTLSAFESNLVTGPPGGGNPNPAGEIDGRLASWYTAINTMYAGNAPYVTWPVTTMLPCGPPAVTYTISGTITGYASPNTGLQVQNVNTGDLISIPPPLVPPGVQTFSLPTPLANGDSYGIQLVQPTGGQTCTVTSGDTGIVNNAAPASVAITCSSPSQPTIGDFGTVPLTAGGEGGEFYFSSGNTSVCVLASLVLFDAKGMVDIFNYSSGSGSIVGGPFPSQYPGYGTDTETLTCYQNNGDGYYSAAFSGPQIIYNPGLPAPPPAPPALPLTITSFTVDTGEDDYGYLSWATSGSSEQTTTCTLISEFGGDGVNTPLAQNPVTGLPANTPPEGREYPWNYCDASCAGLGSDNLTLTCSDPVTGTAVKTQQVTLCSCD
jgi:hypothetical protein